MLDGRECNSYIRAYIMEVIMANATNRKLLLCLAAFLLFPQAPVVLAQESSDRWSRYLPSGERANKYEDETFRPTKNSKVSADCLWITPSVAQSIISLIIDKEKISIEEAERRYAWLLQRDCHLVIISIHWLSHDLLMGQMQILLGVGEADGGVEGAIVKAPFAIPFLRNEGPRDPKYLVCFPRRAKNGEAVIPANTNRLRIAVQFRIGTSGAIIPIPVKQLIKGGAEL
jgi:hypothetical protein